MGCIPIRPTEVSFVYSLSLGGGHYSSHYSFHQDCFGIIHNFNEIVTDEVYDIFFY